MAINDPFQITFGGFNVGGTLDTYVLSGPLSIEKDFTRFALTFGVQVIAATTALLQSLSDSLESAFSNRLQDGDTLVINLDGSTWTYTQNSTILNCESRITKPGNLQTDTAFSRFYAITITGDLPSSVDNGLQNIRTNVQTEATGQRTVSIEGIYTATASGSALANYTSNVDAESSVFLDAVDDSATWELVDQDFSLDRHKSSGGDAEPNLLTFSRQYVELLSDQSVGLRDDPDIKDHRLIFNLVSRFPGEGRTDATRLSEVAANFTCAVDKSVTTDLLGVVANKIRPLVLNEFQTLFPASVFTIQDERLSIDPTLNRIDAVFSILYQSASGGVVITSTQSVAYVESRTIDYVPTHEEDELSFAVSPGFLILERVWSRSITTTNPEPVRRRLSERTSGGDRFDETIGGESGVDNRDGTEVRQEGWNIVENRSQVSEQIFGLNSDGDSFVLTTINEQIVERFNNAPTGRGAGSRPAISG